MSDTVAARNFIQRRRITNSGRGIRNSPVCSGMSCSGNRQWIEWSPASGINEIIPWKLVISQDGRCMDYHTDGSRLDGIGLPNRFRFVMAGMFVCFSQTSLRVLLAVAMLRVFVSSLSVLCGNPL